MSAGRNAPFQFSFLLQTTAWNVFPISKHTMMQGVLPWALVKDYGGQLTYGLSYV